MEKEINNGPDENATRLEQASGSIAQAVESIQAVNLRPTQTKAAILKCQVIHALKHIQDETFADLKDKLS